MKIKEVVVAYVKSVKCVVELSNEAIVVIAAHACPTLHAQIRNSTRFQPHDKPHPTTRG
jgi:hypothetical protein